MSVIENYPALRPALLLDFANSGRVHPLIQCTRASTATCFGPDRRLRNVAANVPRIDYDPATGKCLGLLVEEARTNLILHSNSFSNALWTKSAPITVTPEADDWWDISHNGTGNYAGIYQAGRPNATKSAAFTFDVMPGSLSSVSMFLGINGTSDATRVVFDFAAGTSTLSFVGGVITAAMVTHSLKNMGGFWRLALSVDATSASITPTSNVCYLYPGGAVGAQVAGNIKARRAQLESAAFPTSYIPTDAAAVTRAADLVGIDYTLPTVGAIVSSLAGVSSANTSNAYIWSGINPSDSNADHAYFYHQGGAQSTNWWVKKSSVDQSGGNVVGRRLSSGFSYDSGAKTAAIASGSLFSQDESTRPRDFPSNLSQLLLGRSRANSGFLNGCISRLAVYSGRITNAQLQRLTA